MGMFDNIRNLFRGEKSAPVAPKRDDYYEKTKLEEKAVDLIRNIKKRNTLDSSIWNYSNIDSVYDLQRKNLGIEQLIQLIKIFEARLDQLDRQNQRGNATMESLEASKWTGQRTQGMTNQDLDRFQRDDR